MLTRKAVASRMQVTIKNFFGFSLLSEIINEHHNPLNSFSGKQLLQMFDIRIQ